MGFGSILNRKKKLQSTNSTAFETIPPNAGSPVRNFTQTQLQEIEEVFKKFDANGDGKISASELSSIMKSLAQHPSDEELHDMIKEFDADGDGDGYIDIEEFIELNTKGVE